MDRSAGHDGRTAGTDQSGKVCRLPVAGSAQPRPRALVRLCLRPPHSHDLTGDLPAAIPKIAGCVRNFARPAMRRGGRRDRRQQAIAHLGRIRQGDGDRGTSRTTPGERWDRHHRHQCQHQDDNPCQATVHERYGNPVRAGRSLRDFWSAPLLRSAAGGLALTRTPLYPLVGATAPLVPRTVTTAYASVSIGRRHCSARPRAASLRVRLRRRAGADQVPVPVRPVDPPDRREVLVRRRHPAGNTASARE